MKPAALALLLGTGTALAAPPEPAEYRAAPYGAEVPATLAGAQVVDAAQAIALYDAGAAFVDVYPRTQRPAGLPEATIWNEPQHLTIPGAYWLHDTGYDRLSPQESQRFSDGLAAATADDKSRKLVIFCRAECWLSWNAAKRAISLGYREVNWFPDGTDGWQTAGRDLSIARPDLPAR